MIALAIYLTCMSITAVIYNYVADRQEGRR